jgi:VanZ family protein
MSPERRLAIFRLLFWAAALFAFVMAVLPHPPELPGAPSDKIQHIAAFLVLAALASFAYPATSPVYLGAALSLFGAFIELVQYIPSLHRDSDPLDWIADTAAAALMLMLLHWLRTRFGRAAAHRG